MQINAIESSSNWDLVLVMRPCACVCARATQKYTVSVYKFTCFIQKLCYTSTILILYVYSILILKIPTRIRNETNKHKNNSDNKIRMHEMVKMNASNAACTNNTSWLFRIR